MVDRKIVAAIALIVVIGGVGGYFMFFRGSGVDFDEAEKTVRDFIDAMNDNDESSAIECMDPEFGYIGSAARDMGFPIHIVSVDRKYAETLNGIRMAVLDFEVEKTVDGVLETSSMSFWVRQIDDEWKIYRFTAPL